MNLINIVIVLAFFVHSLYIYRCFALCRYYYNYYELIVILIAVHNKTNLRLIAFELTKNQKLQCPFAAPGQSNVVNKKVIAYA